MLAAAENQVEQLDSVLGPTQTGEGLSDRLHRVLTRERQTREDALQQLDQERAVRKMVVQQLREELEKERESREIIAAQCLDEKARPLIPKP